MRPSQGDGGLDVVVPTGLSFPGPVVDYQVKYFSTNLTASQKKQIERSLVAARETHSDGSGISIEQWFLTLPLDPTREQCTWLADLAASLQTPFPVEWRGLSYLDGLSAKYQDVIDYYLRDGRTRLEDSIAQLRGLVGLEGASDPGRLLLPADVDDPLRKMFLALNRDDPHFKYEYEVTDRPPPLANRPNLLASASRTENDVCVTVHIIARYELATADAPIAISFTIDPAAMDETTQAAWESALRYGTSVELGLGVVNYSEVGLPAGLGWSGENVVIRVGSARSLALPGGRIRWCIVPPGSGLAQPIAEVLILCDAPTLGPQGGTRTTGQDSSELIRTVGLVDGDPPDASAKFTIFLPDLSTLVGRPVQEVVPILRFATNWHAPNRLKFAPEYGPLMTDPDLEIPSPPQLPEWTLRYAEAVQLISDRTGTAVCLPDLADVSESHYNEIRAIATLLQGGSIELTVAEQVLMVPAQDVEQVEMLPPIPRTYPYTVAIKIAGAEIQLPQAELRIPAARLVRGTDATTDQQGSVPMTLLPVDDSPAIVVLT